MIELYTVKLSERMESSLFDRLLSEVSEEKKARIQRFINWEDAQRTLIGDILARTVICNRMKIRNHEISFVLNEYGKPFLKNSEQFHFNISHSGEWVICATDTSVIGTDVEFIKPIDLGIAERFFSKEEYKDLLNKTGPERLQYFYDLWTLKESYIKAEGKGLSIPLDSFTIKANNGNIKVKTENRFRDCHFRQYDIDRNYKLSVCATGETGFDCVEVREVEEIGREFICRC